jgi:methanesulfonate monooxygenase small subunit
MTTSNESIREFVAGTCLLLDDENFDGFLQQCMPDFTYQIVAHSPELPQPMVWLDHDRSGLRELFGMIPKHVRMQGTICRHVSVYRIKALADGRSEVLSRLIALHTDPEGASSVIAVGKYLDVVDGRSESEPKLSARKVELETRSWSPGLHVPL